MKASSERLVEASRELSAAVNGLNFGPPVTHVLNPLDYAWASHEAYLLRFGGGRKRVVFLGMNPGPFGMAQTGVPFGEVDAVREWMGIELPVKRPLREHPMRPVLGFLCPRSEVSGRRLWGLFAARFGTADLFFAEHFVVNYCPLIFFEESGRNRTPDKLPAAELAPLNAACDRHLAQVIEALQPEWVIGVGRFALDCAARVVGNRPAPRLGTILHPSPASPAANRDWAGTVQRQLRELGVWR